MILCTFGESLYSNNALLCPRSGATRVLMEEISSCFDLLLIQTTHKIEVNHGFNPFSLNDSGVSADVVEMLPAQECGAYWAPNQ